jgi:TatA/E family protein of Tat protein translocase
MGFVSGNHILLFIIFLVIVLVIFGPGKLPDVGAGMGKAIREFRKASTDVKDAVMSSHQDAPAAPPYVPPAAEPVTPPPTPSTPPSPVTPPPAPSEGTRPTVHADRGA